MLPTLPTRPLNFKTMNTPFLKKLEFTPQSLSYSLSPRASYLTCSRGVNAYLLFCRGLRGRAALYTVRYTLHAVLYTLEFTPDFSSRALEFTLGVCLLACLPGIGGSTLSAVRYKFYEFLRTNL